MRWKTARIVVPLLAMSIWSAAVAGVVSNEGASAELKAFPKTLDGHDRHVLLLEPKADESAAKIELIPGKTMQIDCNRHFLSGEIEARDVEGWGYTYYVFKTNGQVGSTMMGCPDNSTHEAFVAALSLTIGYNSRLPVVVFAPKGYKVRYRVWSVSGSSADIPQK